MKYFKHILIPNCFNLFSACKCTHLSSNGKSCNLLKINRHVFYYSISTNESAKYFESSSRGQKIHSDSFGTLEKPLEAHRNNLKILSQLKKPVKVIKVKRPKSLSLKDSNLFGTLSESNSAWYPEFKESFKKDNDLSDDSVLVKNISRKYRCPKQYLSSMKNLVKEKKIKSALELFVEMKRNFVTPTHAHFTFMIGACGRIGYTEMAFKLLRQMTDRQLRPTPATLTGLFNSCAESPFPEYGLKKAHMLKEKIKFKNWNMTQLTYHAVIKAFGRCGDIAAAFQVVDEMMENDIKIDVETYSFLLMSCISDKEAGFTYTVEVWRKMNAKKCVPTVFTFNLILRAARDCGIGPENISCLLLQHWSSYLKRPYGLNTFQLTDKKPILQLPAAEVVNIDTSKEDTFKCSKQNINVSNNEDSFNVQHSGDKNIVESQQTIPVSVISERPKYDTEIIDLLNIKSPNDRLSLLGGVHGILKELSKHKLQPSIKTFTLLLECLPQKTDAENELISLLESCAVQPDIGFCNILIKRRNFRHDYYDAHNAFILVNKWNLTPDIITFGVLSIGCNTFNKASSFLYDMKKLGFCADIEIVGALLSNACQAIDFQYMKTVLHLMESENIKPNDKILQKLENTLRSIKLKIIDKEHNKEVPHVYKGEAFTKKYADFIHFYEDWLKGVNVEEEDHVWTQFNTDIIGQEQIVE